MLYARNAAISRTREQFYELQTSGGEGVFEPILIFKEISLKYACSKGRGEGFFQEVLKQARERNLLSDEHFTVDRTLIEAWASLKSFQRKEQEKQENGDEEKDRGNANVNFRGGGDGAIKRMSRKTNPTRNWRAKEMERRPN